MTRENFDRVVSNAKANANFRKQLRENFDAATAGFELTPQERANLEAMDLGAEPGKAKPASRTATGPVDPMASFKSKTRFDEKTGKYHDLETGREVSPPVNESDDPPGTLGGYRAPG